MWPRYLHVGYLLEQKIIQPARKRERGRQTDRNFEETQQASEADSDITQMSKLLGNLKKNYD